MLWFAPFIVVHRYSAESIAQATLKAIASFSTTALLIQAWFHPRFAISWNGPGWSLSVEAAFYLIFPFLAPRLRALSSSGLLVMASLSVALSTALSLIVPRQFANWEYVNELVLFNPLFQIPTFVFGVSLGYYFLRTPERKQNATFVTVVALLAILGIGIVCPLLPMLVVHNSVFLPFFGLLFIGLARGGCGSRFLSRPSTVLLGEASYALYILQTSIGLTLAFLSRGMAPSDYFADSNVVHGSFAVYFALLVIAIVISIFVFKTVESPLLVPRSRLGSFVCFQLSPAVPRLMAIAEESQYDAQIISWFGRFSWQPGRCSADLR